MGKVCRDQVRLTEYYGNMQENKGDLEVKEMDNIMGVGSVDICGASGSGSADGGKG